MSRATKPHPRTRQILEASLEGHRRETLYFRLLTEALALRVRRQTEPDSALEPKWIDLESRIADAIHARQGGRE